MRVAVLGTGSRGNAVAFQANQSTLLVDAGFGVRALKQRAASSGIELESITAIVLTHEHGDHARGAPKLARDLDCRLFASPGTLRALSRSLADVRTEAIDVTRTLAIGPFTVSACQTTHDAAEPLALAVEEDTAGRRVGLAYDVGTPSRAVRKLLQDCQCLIVEANHDDGMLRAGPYPPSVRHRIAGAGGHLSNREAAGLLRDLAHRDLSTVVLAHISDQCNRKEIARHAVSEALTLEGFQGVLLVAGQDTPLPTFEVLDGDGQHTMDLV